jgi:hypothetical protein
MRALAKDASRARATQAVHVRCRASQCTWQPMRAGALKAVNGVRYAEEHCRWRTRSIRIICLHAANHARPCMRQPMRARHTRARVPCMRTGALHNTSARSVAGANLDLGTVPDALHCVWFAATAGFPRVFSYITSLSSNDRFIVRIAVASHSHNGTIVTCAREQTPTGHVDIRTCPLRDIAPPRLRSRAVDTNCPTARRCARGMRPDSESRCRVADGVVD